jgi:cytochrome c oxidase assembly protein subunit 11
MFMFGASYAAVPLYRMFCQASGLAGTVQGPGARQFTPEQMTPVSKTKPLRITFNSDVASTMDWSFRPVTRELKVVPGETALAFYTATNPTDTDIVGISTYNVTPYKAAVYFNKIQCFCFEEQILRAGETVDLPVFFFIDPAFVEDPLMDDVDVITLSYTFFNAKRVGAKVK